MEDKPVLQIKGLTKHYGKLTAVSHLNLTVEKGMVYGLLGPNGSGKTTTLSSALDLIHPSSGEILWFGESGSSITRRQIGSLIEQPVFYPFLTLKDNLRIITRAKKVSDNCINRVLGITKLLDRKYSKFKHLSSGLKQRMALAAVLVGDPEVLILDEPTKGLDPEGFSDLREIISEQKKQGKTIILASHILDEVEKVCTHVGILKEGKLIQEGHVKNILSGKDVVIISGDDLEAISEKLTERDIIENQERYKNEIRVILKKNHTSGDLNKYLLDHGLVLSKLEVQKNKLEAEFLELIK